jgi:hypothetical protein
VSSSATVDDRALATLRAGEQRRQDHRVRVHAAEMSAMEMPTLQGVSSVP